MYLLTLYVALALSVSFLCSILEAVLLSVTPSFVTLAGQEGKRWSKQLHRFKLQIDRPLSAILSLNTIAHTVGAAGAGAQAALVFENISVGVISGALTLAILVFSEIVPKTLGAVYWRRLVPYVVFALEPIIWAMWPLVKLSEALSALLSPKEKHARVSRAELAAMAELGTEEGVLEESESRILTNLLRLHSINARAIMTPRIVLYALPADETVADVVARRDELRFSRIPIYETNRDQITGYVLKQDLLLAAARGAKNTKLGQLRREMVVVPDTLALPTLFDRLLDSREHVALVCDEFGGTAGVVTMEDLIETLLGTEIVDEVDSVDDMQEHARKQWAVRAQDLGFATETEGGEDADEAKAAGDADAGAIDESDEPEPRPSAAPPERGAVDGDARGTPGRRDTPG